MLQISLRDESSAQPYFMSYESCKIIALKCYSSNPHFFIYSVHHWRFHDNWKNTETSGQRLWEGFVFALHPFSERLSFWSCSSLMSVTLFPESIPSSECVVKHSRRHYHLSCELFKVTHMPQILFVKPHQSEVRLSLSLSLWLISWQTSTPTPLLNILDCFFIIYSDPRLSQGVNFIFFHMK